jgi:hypothetical protein
MLQLSPLFCSFNNKFSLLASIFFSGVSLIVDFIDFFVSFLLFYYFKKISTFCSVRDARNQISGLPRRFKFRAQPAGWAWRPGTLKRWAPGYHLLGTGNKSAQVTIFIYLGIFFFIHLLKLFQVVFILIHFEGFDSFEFDDVLYHLIALEEIYKLGF